MKDQEKFNELIKLYGENPELAKEFVLKHPFTKKEFKLIRKSRYLLPKKVRVELDSILELLEESSARND